MRLELILFMGLVSVIHGNTHFPTNSRFFSSLQPSLNIGFLSEKNYEPESTFNFIKMQKPNMNCFVNINNQNDKIFLLSFGSEYKPITRRRRTIHGWKIAEPLYAEEPKWILIEEPNYSQIGQRNYVTNREDPFYITRGKRISTEYLEDYERGQTSSVQRINKSNALPDSKINSENSVSNNSNSPIYYQLNRVDGGSTIQNDGLQLRDKHSDIMDMLLEPFVISRGKKSSNKKDEVEEFLNSVEFNDEFSSRNRRGKLFDQLMKAKDPFYVARGKRHPPIVHSQL